MNRFWPAVLLSSIVLASVGCQGTATVTPAPVKLYAMNQGLLNSPLLGLGYVVALNPANHTAYLLQARAIDASQLRADTIEDLKEAYQGNVEIDVSANVPKAVQAEVKAQAANNLKLNITKGRKSVVTEPVAFSTNDPKIKIAILDAYAGNQNLKFIVVTQGIAADKVEFGSESSGSVTVNVQTVKIGVWKIDVTYKAGATIEGMSGQGGAPLLIKPTPVKVIDGAGGKTLALDSDLPWDELSKYNFIYALQ